MCKKTSNYEGSTPAEHPPRAPAEKQYAAQMLGKQDQRRRIVKNITVKTTVACETDERHPQSEGRKREVTDDFA